MKAKILSILMMFLVLVVGVSAMDLQFDNVQVTPALPATAAPGSQVSYSYEVENTGSVTATGVVVEWTNLVHQGDLTTTMGGFSSGSATPFDLAANATAGPFNNQFFVAVGQKAGTYLATLSVKNGTTVDDTATIEVGVTAQPSVSVSSTTPELIQGQTGTMTVTLTNTGNTDLTAGDSLSYSIAVFSGAGSLSFVESSSGVLSVPFGSSQDLTLTFNVPAGQAVGDYTSTITVSGGASATGTLDASVRAPVTEVTIVGGDIDFGETEREVELSEAFTLQNTGDVTLNNIVLSNNLGTEYGADLSVATVSSLAPGSTASVTLKITLPDSEDSGTQTLGAVSVSSDEGASASADVFANAENHLEFNDVEVRIGDKKKKSVDEGDSVKDVEPFEDIKITVELENTFPDSNDFDFDIEDIDLEIIIRDIDDEDDLEFEPSEFDIKADDKETETISFTVPVTVDDDTEYDVEITAEGEDENGAQHTASFEFSLKVEKEKHELYFDTVELTPETVSCEASAILNVKLINLGQDDEDDVVLKIRNNDLRFDVFEDVGDMSSDWDDDESEFQKFYTINLPSNLKRGNYPLTLEAFREDDELENTAQISLRVEDCDGSSSDADEFDFVDDEDDEPVFVPSKPKDDTVDVVFSDTPTGSAVDTSASDALPVVGANDDSYVVATTVDSSEGSSSWYLVLLVVGNVVVVVMILTLIARALKKRQ